MAISGSTGPPLVIQAGMIAGNTAAASVRLTNARRVIAPLTRKALSLPGSGQPRFHISLHGGFTIGADESEYDVPEMSIVLVQSRVAHWVADKKGRECKCC